MNNGFQFYAMEVGDRQLSLVIPFRMLAQLVRDPDPATRRRKTQGVDHESPAPDLRAMVQREFRGQKRNNVSRYRAFIADVGSEKIDGDMPEIVMWVSSRLEVTAGPAGLVMVTIPPDCDPVIVDGETQVAARFDLLTTHGLDNAAVVVRLHHGRPIEFAEQVFYFRNVKGTQVPRAFALMRDRYNPIATAARELVPILGAQFSEVGAPRSVTLPMLMQALAWLTFRTINEPVRKPPNWEFALELATDHLERRLAILAPLFSSAQSPLYRAAWFVACCDRMVSADVLTFETMRHIAGFKIGQGNPAVRLALNILRQLMRGDLEQPNDDNEIRGGASSAEGSPG